MKAILLIALLAVSAFAYSAQYEELNSLWSTWKNLHNKQYSAGEEAARYSIFVDNYNKVTKYNAEHSNVQLRLNLFADMTSAEFKHRQSAGAFFEDNEDLIKDNTIRFEALAAPTSVDWRTKGVVTPVKDQGQCGSCWAFSVTQEVESAWFLSGQSLPVLAPQQVVSCDTKGADQGCNGGDSVEAYKYLATVGMEGEKDYPYVSGGTGSNGDCTFDATKTVTKPIAGWTYATPACTDDCTKQDEATLAANIAEHGPASICVAADTWQSYTGGIIRDGCASAYSSLDHCVHLVGLETKGADTYWLVKNSWADSWGEQGYIYLAYGSNLCGLADEATFVHF